jgi:hypothetical protein
LRSLISREKETAYSSSKKQEKTNKTAKKGAAGPPVRAVTTAL